MNKNTILLLAGITTLVQACIQFILSGFALAQYFCLIDLLRELPLFLYIRILYFHNPACETRVTIGPAIDGIADQAFVLISNQSLPTFRTFVINSIYFGLSLAWILTSGVLIHGGANNSRSAHVRWPWMAVMVVVFAVDIVATVTFITDIFRTRTLVELVEFAGGVLSGAGNQNVDTSMAAWLMAILYSRFGVTVLFNVFLVICVLVECGNRNFYMDEEERFKDTENNNVEPSTTIPRVSILRRMPNWLSPVSFNRRTSSPYALADSPNRAPPIPPTVDHDKKPTVNFPENLLSLPQRLEHLIVEQQKRLDSAVVDTTGRWTPPRAAQSLPQLHEQPSHDNVNVDVKGRRGTAAELQGQLPWSYMPPTAHRMRDQLPPDEELPPVPVPDYTLHPKYRKASVHRAGSNVSGSQLMHGRDFARSSPMSRYLALPF